MVYGNVKTCIVVGTSGKKQIVLKVVCHSTNVLLCHFSKFHAIAVNTARLTSWKHERIHIFI